MQKCFQFGLSIELGLLLQVLGTTTKKDFKILTLIRQNQMFSLIERIIVGMSIPLTYPEKITVTSAFLSRDFCFDIPFAANLCLPVDSILNIEGFNPLLTN